MAYNNYGNQGGYNRGGYNNQRQQQNNNYGQQQPPQPTMSPQEFINERLEMLMMFLQEAESKGLKSEELLNSGALGGWITSYLSFEKKGR